MFNFFRTRNPLNEVQSLRDRAERLSVNYLEKEAVKGKISRPMVQQHARALNVHPQELIDRIPNRRHARRYAKAINGLREAGFVNEREAYDETYFNQ